MQKNIYHGYRYVIYRTVSDENYDYRTPGPDGRTRPGGTPEGIRSSAVMKYYTPKFMPAEHRGDTSTCTRGGTISMYNLRIVTFVRIQFRRRVGRFTGNALREIATTVRRRRQSFELFAEVLAPSLVARSAGPGSRTRDRFSAYTTRETRARVRAVCVVGSEFEWRPREDPEGAPGGCRTRIIRMFRSDFSSV